MGLAGRYARGPSPDERGRSAAAAAVGPRHRRDLAVRRPVLAALVPPGDGLPDVPARGQGRTRSASSTSRRPAAASSTATAPCSSTTATASSSSLQPPERRRSTPTVTTRVAALLNISLDERRASASPIVRFSPYTPVPVAEDVTKDVAIYLREQPGPSSPASTSTRVAERVYPHGHARRPRARLRRPGQRRRADEAAASDGLPRGRRDREGRRRARLREVPAGRARRHQARGRRQRHGAAGSRWAHRSRRCRATTCSSPIDLDVQRLAEESLAQGLEAARNGFDREEQARSSSRRPAPPSCSTRNDGSVLAMASYPTYDPAGLRRRHQAGGVRRAAQDPESHFPLNNRAIQGQYAPGSTFKLVTVARRPRQGHRSTRAPPSTTRASSRSRTASANAACSATPAASSTARSTCARALTVSSDVYFYQLGAPFWSQRGQGARRDPGHGHARSASATSTGIPLPASSQAGCGRRPTRKQAARAATQGLPRRRLAHRRQRQPGDRPGRAGGHAAAAGQRLRRLRQRRHAASSPASPPASLEPQSRPVADLPTTPPRQIALPAGSDADPGRAAAGASPTRRAPPTPPSPASRWRRSRRRQDRHRPGAAQAGHRAVRGLRPGRASRSTSSPS